MPITLIGKKYALNKMYALNKQVSKYMVIAFFLSKVSIISLVLTGYEFMLPCMYFVYLALVECSTLGYV